MIFHRTYSVPAQDVNLYHPKDKEHAGREPVSKMSFVYGYVESPDGGRRYGWIARDALA